MKMPSITEVMIVTGIIGVLATFYRHERGDIFKKDRLLACLQVGIEEKDCKGLK